MSLSAAPEETTQVIQLNVHIAPRVLIVDDDSLVAEHLAELVRKADSRRSSPIAAPPPSRRCGDASRRS